METETAWTSVVKFSALEELLEAYRKTELFAQDLRRAASAVKVLFVRNVQPNPELTDAFLI
jgi:hypothetical protein